ncbi:MULTISPECIES: bactofilin family protein [Pseudoxanthomonas]|uniref:Cytoskeletal protein CcmA (Bactofilin family) n=1 Tax=Pseudoxanthomonas winnipegensis TaxID=2480810 RepID=A0A4Q8LLC1_9GAMM|nr:MULTISPECIES: polymer-forming cytoskeletal protein [Pseudoxanthomonas]MDQ1117862.1 cytoskeletal protein CcmA (bactofilin family) [Pseudoxanthomonas winnipegensis]MDQ1134833.1 cytoskeletal protein CcmA (bactofilin family) [Pseudoxanthomonas winnipegensis]MDR6138934.1 cytoskeletal protein CcmA (bactofilin family) [Pseudoxanthomonas sp. SORGH_AS_0997]RZZ82505.1 polymer-forming cytoskeletal protein [Pseudoxanthomonas winnipegensis]TAA30463.1 polymer-forming cytoskeletal protein [Pseudoxanthomon
MLKKKSSWHDGQAVDTLIGAQVVLHGDLQFSGGLVVEGRIHGRVFAAPGQPATLTLGEAGLIEGVVDVPVVIVNGRIEGDVRATERVELAPRARVSGNIHYKVVEMRAGAVLVGQLMHLAEGEPAQAAAPVPAQLDALPEAANA